jgi:hypothetical protein
LEGINGLSPLLGEHTDEILKKLGYERKDIENLRQEGVICLGGRLWQRNVFFAELLPVKYLAT